MHVEDASGQEIGRVRLEFAEAPPNGASSHDSVASTPDLRARTVVPPTPVALRLKSWLTQRARAGSSETEADSTIATHLRAMSTGCYTVAVIGPKGGAGKTTTALTAGLICAQYPLARPIVVELNPDWGNARELLGDANPNTIQDLLGGLHSVQRRGIGAIQGYVTMWGRLPVLTAPSDPDGMADLSPRDYDRVLRSLAVHYNLIILDCGTSFTQRLNQYAIQTADHIPVVGNPRHATMSKTVEAVRYIASQRYAEKYRGSLAKVDGGETHPGR
ncbi:MAG: hypothetical protein M3P51_18785 [Chloroflexota bacterium]|nr:hypothetical protein [Chloroflexota bacterium]